MSLLLDALRRAEAAKRRHVEAEEPAPAGFPALDVEATPPVATADAVLPAHEPTLPASIEASPSWTLADTAEPSPELPPALAPERQPLELTLEAPPPMVAPIDTAPAAVSPAEVAEARPAVAPSAEAAMAAPPPRKPLFEKATPSLGAEPLGTPSTPIPTPTPTPAPAAAVKLAAAGPASPSPAEQDKRETAKRVVAAAKRPREPLNRTLLLALGGGVAVLGAAAYLWWQMQPPGSITLFGALPPSVATRGAADEANPPPAPPGTAEQAAPAAAAKPSPAEAPATSTNATVAPVLSPAKGRHAAPDGSPTVEAKASAVPAPVAAAWPQRERNETSAVRFVPGQAEQAVMQPVRRGYAAYQAGNLPAAATAYQEALSDDPGSRDAMLGLAAVAARQGRMTEAQQWYQRVLAANPQDPDAQAGLAAVSRSQQPADREARLRGLIEAQPERAELAQELAGLYASQQRWGEAQQAYFRAFTLDQDNPDAAFNLAVSLEHIDQPKAALDYYRKAQALAERRTPRFPPAVAEQRIAALTREGAAKQ